MKIALGRDLFAGILFFLLGLGTVFLLIPSGVTVPGSVRISALSPDFWPSIIAYCTVAASVFLILEGALLKQPEAEIEEAEEYAKYQLATLPAALRTAILMFALFAFYGSLTTLGVVAASVVLMGAMMLFFGERKIWLIALLSGAIPVLLYLFFRYVAGVPIPLGVFGN